MPCNGVLRIQVACHCWAWLVRFQLLKFFFILLLSVSIDLTGTPIGLGEAWFVSIY